MRPYVCQNFIRCLIFVITDRIIDFFITAYVFNTCMNRSECLSLSKLPTNYMPSWYFLKHLTRLYWPTLELSVFSPPSKSVNLTWMASMRGPLTSLRVSSFLTVLIFYTQMFKGASLANHTARHFVLSTSACMTCTLLGPINTASWTTFSFFHQYRFGNRSQWFRASLFHQS